jgi:hypothetical protein
MVISYACGSLSLDIFFKNSIASGSNRKKILGFACRPKVSARKFARNRPCASLTGQAISALATRPEAWSGRLLKASSPVRIRLGAP